MRRRGHYICRIILQHLYIQLESFIHFYSDFIFNNFFISFFLKNKFVYSRF